MSTSIAPNQPTINNMHELVKLLNCSIAKKELKENPIGAFLVKCDIDGLTSYFVNLKNADESFDIAAALNTPLSCGISLMAAALDYHCKKDSDNKVAPDDWHYQKDRKDKFAPILTWLLDNGADVNIGTAPDYMILNLMFVGVPSTELLNMAPRIIASANPRKYTAGYSTPLHHIAKKNLSLIHKIGKLTKKVDKVNADKDIVVNKQTHYIKNIANIVDILIRAGFDVNAVDEIGGMPIHYAIPAYCKGNDLVFNVLLKNGADLFAKSTKNRTVMTLCLTWLVRKYIFETTLPERLYKLIVDTHPDADPLDGLRWDKFVEKKGQDRYIYCEWLVDKGFKFDSYDKDGHNALIGVICEPKYEDPAKFARLLKCVYKNITDDTIKFARIGDKKPNKVTSNFQGCDALDMALGRAKSSSGIDCIAAKTLLELGYPADRLDADGYGAIAKCRYYESFVVLVEHYKKSGTTYGGKNPVPRLKIICKDFEKVAAYALENGVLTEDDIAAPFDSEFARECLLLFGASRQTDRIKKMVLEDKIQCIDERQYIDERARTIDKINKSRDTAKVLIEKVRILRDHVNEMDKRKHSDESKYIDERALAIDLVDKSNAMIKVLTEKISSMIRRIDEMDKNRKC